MAYSSRTLPDGTGTNPNRVSAGRNVIVAINPNHPAVYDSQPLWTWTNDLRVEGEISPILGDLRSRSGLGSRMTMADVLRQAQNRHRLSSLQEQIWLRHRRDILRRLRPNDVLRAQVEATQENFDIAVEEANVPLVKAWQQQYGFALEVLPVIRSNNADLLDMIEDWGDWFTTDYNYTVLITQVADTGNLHYLRKFKPRLHEALVRAGWLEGVEEVLDYTSYPVDYDLVILAIQLQQWDILRVLLSALTQEQKDQLAEQLRDRTYLIYSYQPELIDIFIDSGVNNWIPYR